MVALTEKGTGRMLLTERAAPCFIDFTTLNESSKGFVKELPDGRYRVRAKGQHCGVQNRNGRVYPTSVWEKLLREGAEFAKKIKTRRVIGHLEHPDDGKSKMPLGAIVVTEASPPDQNGEVWITFETLSTPPGKIVEAYIRCRVGYGLSSRGNGSLVTRNGVDEVQDDFDPITWDCVIDESTPGAEVAAVREDKDSTAVSEAQFREFLDAAKRELQDYVQSLTERADGDANRAAVLAEEDARKAASAVDCSGDVCKCPVTESEMPPSGYSRYLLAFEDGSAHYRAYQGTTGQWEVWLHPHNLQPNRLASKLPTLDTAQQVAENHYRLILASGQQSAQQHAAHSNAIGQEARTPQMAPVAPPSPHIGGMAAMMQPQPQPRAPRLVLSFESLEEALSEVEKPFQEWLEKMQEEWRQVSATPYSGTVVEMSCASAKECRDARSALERAGFFVAEKGDTSLTVHTSYEDGEQASAHIQRVLEKRGIQKTQTEAVGVIRHGRAITEDMMSRLTFSKLAEQGPDVDGDTPEVEDPHGISPDYEGDDPEDIDLDLDVNEADDMVPLDYDLPEAEDDYEDDDENPHAAALARMPGDLGGGEEEPNAAALAHEGDYYESESVMTRSPTAREAETAMFAKAFERAEAKQQPKQQRAEGHAYYRTFARNRMDESGKKTVGAVRVWFNESDEPVTYEFYNSEGILERIQSATGEVIHDVSEGATGKPRRRGTSEVWESEDGARVDGGALLKLLRLREGDLKTRHGADTGVKMRGDNWKGKQGGEYDKDTAFQDKTNSGDDQPDKPGDLYKASEEGDGEHIKRGTWPTTGDPASGVPKSHTAEAAGVDMDYVANLREKIAFLEDELARYEDIVQEQQEAIESLKETYEQERLERERMEVFESYPELGAEKIRHRLMQCESVSDLRSEVGTLLSLVESTRQPAQPRMPEEPQGGAQALSETAEQRPTNGVASTQAQGAPTGVLTESSHLSERLSGGSIGIGDVASRVAAARKRRRRR